MKTETEQRIGAIERMVLDIHSALFPEIDDNRVNEHEFNEAIREARKGNPARLQAYLRRGGQVPAAVMKRHRESGG